MKTTYPSAILDSMTRAVTPVTANGKFRLHRIAFHTTATGSRAVLRDLGNGQDYEILVNPLNQ